MDVSCQVDVTATRVHDRILNYKGILPDIVTENLRCLPVQGVDFLGADVAQHQWRITRSQARPVVGQTNVLQAEQPFKLVISDAHTIEAELTHWRIKVNVL